MKKLTNILLPLLLLGCSPLLPLPTFEVEQSYNADVNPTSQSCDVQLRWWESFESTLLDSLIEKALIKNRDLAASAASVESSRAYISVAKAEFLPSFSFDVEAESYRINGVTTNEYKAAPALSWELSLFGAMRDARRGAVAKYLSEEWGYRAAHLSLTSQVATSLFTLAGYECCLVIAQRSYELRVEATALVDSMHRYGMSSGIALQQAKSLVYSAQSEVSKYQRAVGQSRSALGVLLGEAVQESFSTEELIGLLAGELPMEVAPGLPSELLERRPDVMESYFKMGEAAANVGVQRAQRFPSISLTADGGFVTETLKDLSSAKPFGWSVAGDLTQPIFNFGALKRKEQMAYEQYRAAMLDYEQSFLVAVSEVENALIDISTYRQESVSAHELVEANAKIAEATSALYRSGLGDYLSVIDAERELYSSQIECVELIAQQYINYISLCKALGGGFMAQ